MGCDRVFVMPEGILKQEIKEMGPDFEITPNTKRDLGNAWTEMVVDTEVPENIENFDNAELREWLFNSVMDGVEDFVEENNISVDESVITKLAEEKDDSKRAEIELRYIKEIQKSMTEFSKSFRSRNEVTTWNSWPSLMKETGSYNCVGGTLVGIHFLEKAGIEHFYGGPVGHAVNVVKLSDGRLVYADFTNQTVKEVASEEIEIESISALKIDDPNIEYGFVSIQEPKEIVAAILGNIASMPSSGSLETIKTARAFVDNNLRNFEKVGFGKIAEKLYPYQEQVRQSREMKADRERIDTKRELMRPLNEYKKQLSYEYRDMLFNELRDSVDKIRALILDEHVAMPENVSDKVRAYCEVLIGILKEEQVKGVVEYERAKSYFISLIDSVV